MAPTLVYFIKKYSVTPIVWLSLHAKVSCFEFKERSKEAISILRLNFEFVSNAQIYRSYEMLFSSGIVLTIVLKKQGLKY